MGIKIKFNRIYPFTTENIFGYINKFDLYNKSLLTIGSSSDQVINAAIYNCKDISVIDICPFTEFYFYLKKAAILYLKYNNILLSNLGQYFEIGVLKNIVDNISKNLNEEGKMLICYLYKITKNTLYRDEWAEIYNLKKVYSKFKEYLLELNSFIGIDGIHRNWGDVEDSILTYKKEKTLI